MPALEHESIFSDLDIMFSAMHYVCVDVLELRPLGSESITTTHLSVRLCMLSTSRSYLSAKAQGLQSFSAFCCRNKIKSFLI